MRSQRATRELRALIMEYVKEVIGEAAVGLPDAEDAGLALHVREVAGVREYVLWDPVAVERAFREAAESIGDGELKKPSVVARAARDLMMDDTATYVKGIIKVKLPGKGAWGAGQVNLAIAAKGYGPFMYDVAMSDIGTLMADRGSVSNLAYRIWYMYKTTGKTSSGTDVRALRLDDIDDPKTPPKTDDAVLHGRRDSGNPLNYAYRLIGAPVDSRPLRKTSEEALVRLAPLGLTSYFIDSELPWEKLWRG